ncbi:MAG: hypothetical protein HY791_02870 [Deltaproteobacteria bacterium]|nr:hypothetical protein [Deltaproteobacteria bacterium]
MATIAKPTTPTLADLIRDAIEARLADLHTGLPARVVDYDTTKQTCSAQPLMIRVVLENGAEVPQHMPQLVGVPVVFPGGGGWELRWDLVPGDIVFLAFAERSLDRWKSSPKIEQDPFWVRKHHISDAIAIPGLKPSSVTPTAPIRIGRVDGAPSVELRPDGTAVIDAMRVELGAGAAKGVARVGDKVRIPPNTFLVAAQAGVMNATEIDVQIVEGSANVVATD